MQFKSTFTNPICLLSALACGLVLSSGCGDGGSRADNTGGTGNSATGGNGNSTGGSAGTGGSAVTDLCQSSTVVASEETSVIDDLEDMDTALPAVDGRVGGWWVSGDATCEVTPIDEGAPTPEAPSGANNASNGAIHVGADLCSVYGFGVSLTLNAQAGACAYDVSKSDGIYFWAKTDNASKSIRVTVYTRPTIPLDQGGDGSCDPPTGTDCWNGFGKDITLTDTWQLYSYVWTDLAQGGGWGTPATFSAAEVVQIGWSATHAVMPMDFWVDEVGFYKGTAPSEITIGAPVGAGGAGGGDGAGGAGGNN